MYVKLFSSILTSSVWAEDNATRIVWITMLALADKDGDVRASPSGLARLANVSVEDCRRAVARFLAPDAESGTPDDDGRRIEQRDGGWHILNYVKYRTLQDVETRKAQWRENSKAYRQRASSARHRPSSANHLVSSQAEADTEAEAKAGTATTLGAGFPAIWASYPKRAGSNPRQAAYTAFCARIREGVGVGDLQAAVGRYAAFCAATGKVGTEYVMQGKRFFGPSGGWREPWDIPATRPTNAPAAGRTAIAEWLAEREHSTTDGSNGER